MVHKAKFSIIILKSFVWIILFSIASYVLYFFSFKVFILKTIVLEAQGIDLEIDKNKLPNNLLFFPSDRIRLELLQKYPLIGNLSITKIYPDKLLIKAFKREAIAILNYGSQNLLIDRYAIVLGQTENQIDLPILYFDVAVVSKGQKIINNQISTSLDFIEETKNFLKISSITTYDSKSILAKSENTSIYFPQKGNIEKIATLQTLVNGFRIKGILPQVIDLRYDKPVISK